MRSKRCAVQNQGITLSQILTVDFLKSVFWNVIDLWTIFVLLSNGPLQSYVVYVE